MDYKRLHAFKIKPDSFIIMSDPCHIDKLDWHTAMKIDLNGVGLVSLIDDDNIMMLSLDAPDELKIDGVHEIGIIGVDAGILGFITETVAERWREMDWEDVIAEFATHTDESVIYRTKNGDGQYEAFTCFNQGEIVALCIWRGTMIADQKPDEDYIFDLFNYE